MRRPARPALLTACLAMLLSAGVFATPAGAKPLPRINVTPDTGLTDGQRVTVYGFGFTATPAVNGGWAVTECKAAILASTPPDIGTATQDCDIVTQPFVIAKPHPSGVIHKSFVLRQTINLLGQQYDCGDQFVNCAILVAQVTTDGGFFGAAAPIKFGSPVAISLNDCRYGRWRTSVDWLGQPFATKDACFAFVRGT